MIKLAQKSTVRTVDMDVQDPKSWLYARVIFWLFFRQLMNFEFPKYWDFNKILRVFGKCSWVTEKSFSFRKSLEDDCALGHLNLKMISMGTEMGVKLVKMNPWGLVPGHLVQNWWITMASKSAIFNLRFRHEINTKNEIWPLLYSKLF